MPNMSNMMERKVDFTRSDVYATDRGMSCPCGVSEGNAIWVFSYYTGDTTIAGQCVCCHRYEEFPAKEAYERGREVTIHDIKRDHLRAREATSVNERCRIVYEGSR